MKLKLIALILLPAALLPAALVTSCTADDELSGPVAVAPAHAVPLTLQLERQSPATYGDAPAATRSPRWDAVNNLQILIYSNNGTKLHYLKYFENLGGNTDNLDLEVPEGANLVAYAIANVLKNTFTASNAATVAKLESITSYSSTWDAIDKWSALTMSGRSAVFTVAANAPAPVVKLSLRRLVARLDLTIAAVPGTTVSKVELRNVPMRGYYLHREMTGERSGTETNADNGRTKDSSNKCKDAAAGTIDWITAPLGTVADTYRVYMYENRPGVSANTDPTQKGPHGDDLRCTHLYIKGKNATHDLEWQIYLGGNATSNYNIKRNAIYTVSVTLQDGDRSDVRIARPSKAWQLPDDGVASGTWAGSNIYWDAAKSSLTFDSGNNTTHQDYMGVYFQWGSLVGLSTVGNWSSSSSLVYVTTPYSGSAESGAAKPAWSSGSASSKGFSNYKGFPYVTTDFGSGNYGKDKQHLYYTSQTDKTNNWKDFRGDICQYLGEIGAAPSGYRMPTANEFGVQGDYTFSGEQADYTAVKADGTDSFTGKRMAIKNGATHFPAAGCRGTTGALNSVGKNGDYWSGSAVNASNSYELYFTTNLSASSNASRQYAHSVRCIKN